MFAMKKCVACQRKSSLCDRVRTFFVPKREELKQNGRKQQDEGNAGEEADGPNGNPDDLIYGIAGSL